jgi:hypothetical protein
MPQPLSQFSPAAAQGANGQATIPPGGGKDCGVVTTENLTTGAGATLTYTIFTEQARAAGDGSQSGSVAFVSIANGSNTQGDPSLQMITVSQGKITVTVVNRHTTQAFNGSLKIAFILFN